jgi:hypothetical protein
MDIDMQTLLTARFIAAIRKTFNPCPLIGANWFKYYPDGKPVDFQFAGLRRLAKAAARRPAAVAQLVIANLDLKGVEAVVRMTSKEDAINVRLKSSPALAGLPPEQVARKLAQDPAPKTPPPDKQPKGKPGKPKFTPKPAKPPHDRQAPPEQKPPAKPPKSKKPKPPSAAGAQTPPEGDAFPMI